MVTHHPWAAERGADGLGDAGLSPRPTRRLGKELRAGSREYRGSPWDGWKAQGRSELHRAPCVCLVADDPIRLLREVVLLTDDRNLRVKALTRNVPVRDIPTFLKWAQEG